MANKGSIHEWSERIGCECQNCRQSNVQYLQADPINPIRQTKNIALNTKQIKRLRAFLQFGSYPTRLRRAGSGDSDSCSGLDPFGELGFCWEAEDEEEVEEGGLRGFRMRIRVEFVWVRVAVWIGWVWTGEWMRGRRERTVPAMAAAAYGSLAVACLSRDFGDIGFCSSILYPFGYYFDSSARPS